MDNGVFFDNGQDVVRKDIVELICRMFDRENLSFVAAIEFSGLLPELEAARSTHAFPGIDLVSAEQQTWQNSETSTQDFRPPYNPLNTRVQQAVTGAVEDVAERYSFHRSFQGVAVLVNDHTTLGLPGDYWGCDRQTLEAFVRAMGLDGSGESGDESTVRPKLEKNLDMWQRWRCREIGSLFERMAGAVKHVKPSAHFFVVPLDDTIDRAVQPGSLAELSAHSRAEQRLLSGGIDLGDLGQRSGISILRTQAIGRWRSPFSAGPMAESASPASEPSAGILFCHQSIWAEFAQLEAENPFGRTAQSILRFQQLVPGGVWNRRRFVTSLLAADVPIYVDGGWGIPQGEEGATADLFEAFTALPAARFDAVSPRNEVGTSPLVVRQFHDERQGYFYIANTTPWPIDAEVFLTPMLPVQLSSLSNKSFDVDSQIAFASAKVHLDAFDFAAARIPASVDVTDYRAQLPTPAAAQLQYEILKLKSKLSSPPNDASTSIPLINANFETTAQPSQIPGWQVAADGAWQAELDTTTFYEGQASLRLQGHNGGITVSSQPISAPKTGRISVAVWTRFESPTASLKISLRGKYGDEVIERSQPITFQASTANGVTWQQRTAHFNDLPGELSDVQVVFSAAARKDLARSG